MTTSNTPEEPTTGTPDHEGAAEAPTAALPTTTPGTAATASQTRATPADPGTSNTSGTTTAPTVEASPVWTAASTSTPAGSTPREPPARGVRVGQLVWAGIVIVLGLYLVLLALLPQVDFALLMIGLVALLGIGLIITAVLTGRRRGA